MTNEDLKKVIEDLKKHVDILGFNLYKIKTVEKTDLSLETSKIAHKHIEDIFNTDIRKLDRHLSQKIGEQSQKNTIKKFSKMNASKDKSNKNVEAYFATREALISHAVKKRSKK